MSQVAAEARLRVAEQEAARTLPWIGAQEPADTERLQDEQHSRMHRVHNFQFGGLGKLIGADDPRHAPQENGGRADSCYLDGGDILCHPLLVLPCQQAFDIANGKIGAEQNQQKTDVRLWVCVSPQQSMDISHSELPSGPSMLAKANFIRAMHERVQQ